MSMEVIEVFGSEIVSGTREVDVIEFAPSGPQGIPGAVDSVNGRAGPVVLTSADVGLSNVNNTSDASKPVSTAQAAADTAVATAASNALAAHVAAADPHTGYALESSLAAVATSGAYADLTGKPTLGTAAPLNVAASGDAASGEVVKGNDSRLTNARTPTAHTHPSTDINDSTTAGRALLTAADAAAQRTALGLNSVENTALSTWAGSANITTVGTVGTGTWNATAIADGKIASALTGKTYNGLTLTALATGFSVAGGTTSKTLTLSNTLTLSGTDGSTLNIGSGGTLGTGAYATIANYVPIGAATASGLTMSAARLLGRTTAATGAVEEITPGANLSLAAGSLSVTPSGTSKQIQYNNAGTLGGVPQLEFDAATNELRLGVGLTYNNNTGTLTLRQKAGGVANLLEVLNSSGVLTMSVNNDGNHLAPSFIDPAVSLRATGYIENSGRYIDSALNSSSGGAGDVLIISTGSPATSKIATVAEREKTPLGVGTTFNAPWWVSYRGKETVNADSGAISIGDRLVMSATTGGLVCADTTNNIALATVGYALTAKAGGSPGTITAWIHPTPGYKTLTVESLTTVGVVKQTVYTVATLPSASTSGNGARSHVSDALSPTFGATVAAGGSVSTPVYSDGTNWKVG